MPARKRSRGQGSGPSRDDSARDPGAAGVHHHHRGGGRLRLARSEAITDAVRDRSRRRSRVEAMARAKARRSRKAAPRLGSVGGARVDARHDGHDPEPRHERRGRRAASPKETRQRALRVRRLSSLHHDVLGRRAACAAQQVRASTSTRRATKWPCSQGPRRSQWNNEELKRRVPDSEIPAESICEKLVAHLQGSGRCARPVSPFRPIP